MSAISGINLIVFKREFHVAKFALRDRVRPSNFIPPFQGFQMQPSWHPGLGAWADIFRPFRAKYIYSDLHRDYDDRCVWVDQSQASAKLSLLWRLKTKNNHEPFAASFEPRW